MRRRVYPSDSPVHVAIRARLLLSGNANIKSRSAATLRRDSLNRGARLRVRESTCTKTKGERRGNKERKHCSGSFSQQIPPLPCFSPFFYPILHPFIRVSFLYVPAFEDPPPPLSVKLWGGLMQRSKLIEPTWVSSRSSVRLPVCHGEIWQRYFCA